LTPAKKYDFSDDLICKPGASIQRETKSPAPGTHKPPYINDYKGGYISWDTKLIEALSSEPQKTR
jgi:hypothetical protein